MLRVTKYRILALAAAAITLAAYGQLRPNTAISKFRLPLFDEAGNQIWQLTGDRGTYQSASQIKIEGMLVNQYTGDPQDNRKVAELSSPEAIFHSDTTTAYGPGKLHVKTSAFEVNGFDWIWVGDKKQITFNNTVKVTIFEGIGDILK